MENRILILGTGCANCNKLEENTKIPLKELGMNLKIEQVTDFSQIATYGVISTPALVKNGKVLSYGKVLTPKEIKKLIGENN